MIRTARDLCEYHAIRLSPAGAALLRADDTPRRYFDRLRAERLLADARHILAHGLPRRRALWWAYACAQQAVGNHLPASLNGVLDAVRVTIIEPTDARRQALEVLDRAELDEHPMVACLAVAVFLGGGTVSKEGLPFVAPKPFVVPRLVSSVVYLAAVHNEPVRYLDRLEHNLEAGLSLAGGPAPWKTEAVSLPEIENGVFAS